MKELEFAIKIRDLVAKLSPEEKVNLAGYLDAKDEWECDGYGIETPSVSFDVCVAVAEYVRQSMLEQRYDSGLKFVIVGKSLMGNMPNRLVYLTANNGNNFANWTDQIKDSKTFDTLKQASQRKRQIKQPDLIHWSFLLAVPNITTMSTLSPYMPLGVNIGHVGRVGKGVTR